MIRRDRGSGPTLGASRWVPFIPFIVVLVGCTAIGGGRSTYRSDLEATLIANNLEERETLGVEVSDNAVGCMAAASLGNFSDHELREAGVTSDNVVERLPDLNESLDEHLDATRIASGLEDAWNCLDRKDYVAITALDPAVEEVLNCMIDELGYDTVKEFNIRQSIAEEAGGDAPDSTEISAVADACAGVD